MIEKDRIELFVDCCRRAETVPSTLPTNEDMLNNFEHIAFRLEELLLEYQAKNNPLHLMMAYCLACEKDFEIPKWVKQKIYNIFYEYISKRGDASIDKLLKIKGSGLGGNALKRLSNEITEKKIAMHVNTLRKIGFSQMIACHLVSFRSKNIAKIKLSYSRIDDIYDHYRRIKGDKSWFGFLWDGDYEYAPLVFEYLDKNGFILSDKSDCEIAKDPKMLRSYNKCLSKYVGKS